MDVLLKVHHQKDEGTKEAPTKETSISKIGLGHITSIGKSKELGTDANGKEVLPYGT